MSNDKPTIALVHGAFAESASWNPVIERLHRHRAVTVAGHSREDYRVVAIANPLRDLPGDARFVRDAIAGLGTPVLLVGHSYGGMVITEAAADNNAVVGLVYVNVFAPDHGESAFDLSDHVPREHPR